MSEAACQEVPHQWFFETLAETKHERLQREQKALAVCWGECEVREECLAFALITNERYGVWGGFTDAGRRAEKRKMAREHAKTTP